MRVVLPDPPWPITTTLRISCDRYSLAEAITPPARSDFGGTWGWLTRTKRPHSVKQCFTYSRRILRRESGPQKKSPDAVAASGLSRNGEEGLQCVAGRI